MHPGQGGVSEGEGFGVGAGEHGLTAAGAVTQRTTQELPQAPGQAQV